MPDCPRPMRRRLIRAVAAILLVGGVVQFGLGAALPAKAMLAQWLIKRAWASALDEGNAPAPWPWADTRPVARLMVPDLDVDLYVLAGASGRTLAFGPGHMDGSASPGEPGLSIIGGHRDTSFRFLEDVTRGMEVKLQPTDGEWLTYRVTAIEIVDSRSVWIADPQDGVARIALVTCYPFDAIRPGGPLRYWVQAEAIAPNP